MTYIHHYKLLWINPTSRRVGSTNYRPAVTNFGVSHFVLPEAFGDGVGKLVSCVRVLHQMHTHCFNDIILLFAQFRRSQKSLLRIRHNHFNLCSSLQYYSHDMR